MKKPKSPPQFTGATLDQWLGDHENIRWAQIEPRFKLLVSVVLNELQVAAAPEAGCSEGRAFGRVEGYYAALGVLRRLGQKPPKMAPDIEATHDEPPDKSFQNQDTVD